MNTLSSLNTDAGVAPLLCGGVIIIIPYVSKQTAGWRLDVLSVH